MQTDNEVLIKADARTVYELAAAVERWPEILPHYRWVRILGARGNTRLVEMAARRDFFPVWWCAEQTCYPDEPRITFRHVRGITRGMEVEWSFRPTTEGLRVRIHHDLTLRWPIIGHLVAERIIGPLFVAYIAGKTLRRIKSLAEDSAR